MFKKLLSILLSIVLILTSIIGAVIAENSNSNTVLSLDFENYPSGGALNKFKVADTGDADHGKALCGNFSAADANASPAAAIFTSGTSEKLQKGVEYEITLSYKAVNLNSTFALHLFYADNANSYVRKKVPNTTTNTPAMASPYVVRFAHNGSGATPLNQWQTTTVSFTPEYDAYAYLGFWTNTITEIYIDDVVISKKVATPPEPVDPPVIPDQKDSVIQDFEGYTVLGGRLANYTLFTSNGTDGNAHSGTKSLYRSAENKTYRVALFPDETKAPLVAGDKYELRFFIKIASAIGATGTIQLMYSPDKNNANAQVEGSSMPNICVLKKVGETSTNIDTSKVGEWQEVVYSFVATHNGFLNLSGWGANEYYLDDVTLKKIIVANTTISFNTNGGNEIEAVKGVAGEELPTLASPEKEGFAFGGWYVDEGLTTPFTETTFPNSDITLYAKWKQEGVWEQDFEGYSASGGRLVNYTLFTSNGTDGNAHSGTKSLYRSAENKTYRVALFSDETKAPLVAGDKYELRFFIKIASEIGETGTIQLMYSPDKNNANAQVEGSSMPNICVLKKVGETSTNIDTSKVGEWQEVVYSFIATHSGFLNLSGWGATEYYLDDITLKHIAVANSTISFNTNGGNEIEAIKGVAGDTLLSMPIPVLSGKIFGGWYIDEELTTPFASTVFPENEITLYAMWIEPGDYSQNFEGYTISGSIASNTMSVYTAKSTDDPFVHDGNKSLYKPAVKNSYFVSPFPYVTDKLEKGKGYKLNMWVYAPQKIEKDSEGAWQLTLLDAKENAFSVGERKKINIKYFNSSFKEGEWQRLELIFIASDDGYMGLYAYGAFEMYIDDVTLVEVDTVTVSFDTCGGNPMESLSGPANMLVSEVPTPVHPNDMAFAGWFTDKEYTEKFDFKKLPETNITLYAKWIKKGSFEQTFENYYYENDTANGTYTKDVLSVYHAKSENDEFVHSGKTSMRYYQKLLPVSKTYGFSIFDPTMGQLKIGEKYYVSYWIKPVEISNTFYHAVYNNSVVDNAFANYNMKGYFTTHTDVIGKTGDVSEYFFGPAGKYSVSEPDENGWIKLTFETIATDKYFSIYLNYDAEVYIDDVVIEPIPTGVISENFPKPFAESLYDEIYSNYPAAAITRSDEVQIYKLDLTSRGDYVFSADIRPNTMGAYVALSFDGVNIIEGSKITLNDAKRIMLDMSGTVYLHVYNPIGESLFGRLMLFNTRAGKNDLAAVPETNPNAEIPELSELLKLNKYAEVLAEAEFDMP